MKGTQQIMTGSYDFYVIPDLHMIPPGLTLTSEQRLDQRTLIETPKIHEAVFAAVCADTDIDTIIVPGDLTNSGEKEAHLALVKELEEIEKKGKKIFVISAAHDYCKKTRFTGYTPTERNELTELYRQFMFDKAESVAPDGFSYSAVLKPGLFLLALNDDKKPEDGVKGYGFTKETFDWIKTECEKAKGRGDRIIAMTHHPMLPVNTLYPVIALGDMVENWKDTAAFLADCGVEIMFTGHTHMHGINYFDSVSGNRIYDVNTASIVGYPTAYRKIHMDSDIIDIKTVCTPKYEWDSDCETANEHAYKNFRRLLESKAQGIMDGGESFGKAVGMSPEKVKKLGPVVNIAGLAVKKLTVGGLGKILGISRKIAPSLKDMMFRDLIFDLVLSMYHGGESYTPDTPVYQTMNAIFERVEKFCDLFKIKGVREITENLRAGFLYDLPPADWDAVIKSKK
ncbi:MAG: metallophosphoesterase [Clostridia bacterium]|nr:metallophosphoesterase [Clostridia bacterium]